MARRMGRSLRRRSLAAAMVLTGAVALAGCGSSDTNYVKSSADKTYFKMPSAWKTYDEDAILAQQDDLSGDERDEIASTSWRFAFDASPEPTLAHVFATKANFPAGFAFVQPLSQESSDQISDKSMRNYFVGIDDALEGESGEVLAYEALNLDGGLHGLRLTARVTPTDDEGATAGEPMTFQQVILVNQDRTKLHGMFVSCTVKCFRSNQGEIDGIFDSWTVKDD